MLEFAGQIFPHPGDIGAHSIVTVFAIFFFASFVLVPRTFLCLGAGAALGFSAVLVVLPSTILGGILAFLLARYVLSDRIRRYVFARPRWSFILETVDEEGWRLLALLRFASPIPNAVQNYVFAFTSIRLLPYVIISLVCSIPQLVLYVYLGSVSRTLFLNDDLSMLNRIWLIIGLLSLGLAAHLVFRERGRVILRRASTNSRGSEER